MSWFPGRWATLALLLVVFGADIRAETPDELWQQGLSALKANNVRAAESSFQEWIRATDPHGAHSPEVHYNLGMVYWELKQPGAYVFHLLQSSAMSFSPVRILSTLSTVAGIQRELGLRDSSVEDPWVRATLAIPRNLLWVALVLGFWGVVAAGLTAWLQGPRAHRAAKQILIFPAFCLVFAVTCFTARMFLPTWQVLVEQQQNGIRVYRLPNATEENRLVDLPSGSLVVTGRKERGYTEIQTPIAGWVISASAQHVNL